MSEEKNNIVPENGSNDNTVLEKTDSINNNDNSGAVEVPSVATTDKNSNNQVDVSKVKIRTILKQRFKKCPILKKVIPLVLVGIICFGAGLIAGRGLNRFRNQRFFMNGRGYYRQMSGNFKGGNFSNRQFNNRQPNNKNNVQPNNKAPQATPPAATN